MEIAWPLLLLTGETHYPRKSFQSADIPQGGHRYNPQQICSGGMLTCQQSLPCSRPRARCEAGLILTGQRRKLKFSEVSPPGHKLIK